MFDKIDVQPSCDHGIGIAVAVGIGCHANAGIGADWAIWIEIKCQGIWKAPWLFEEPSELTLPKM